MSHRPGQIEGLGRHGREGLPDLSKISAFRDFVQQGMSQREAALQAGLGPGELATLMDSGEIGGQGWDANASGGLDPSSPGATDGPDYVGGQGLDPASSRVDAPATGTQSLAPDSALPRFEPGFVPNFVNRLLNGGSPAQSTQPSPSAMIERLFTDNPARADGAQNLNTTAQRVMASADTARADATQTLPQVRSEQPYGARTEVPAAQARPETGAGYAGSAAAQSTAAERTGLPANQPASAATGGQTAVQAQQADAGLALRQGEAPPPAVARDGGSALQASDRNPLMQQQPASQNASLPQGRTDATPAQVAAQLAGATVAANALGVPLPSQVAPPALPMAQPPGADTAAAQARETTILQPAGHTAAGNLRRDLRPGGQALHKPVDWMLALIPGHARRRGLRGEDESVAMQWAFWMLTTVAYGALALAVVAMVSDSGKSLIDPSGKPSYGAYALIIGGVTAIASWFIGKRLEGR